VVPLGRGSAYESKKRRQADIAQRRILGLPLGATLWKHESFENEGIAEVMNGNFVNIKVDREGTA